MGPPHQNMQESLQSQADQLIPFLRDLANSLEANQLSSKQLENIGDFFMSYQFQEQARKDDDQSIPPIVQYTNAELVKFVSMGWYIYQLLRLEQSL